MNFHQKMTELLTDEITPKSAIQKTSNIGIYLNGAESTPLR